MEDIITLAKEIAKRYGGQKEVEHQDIVQAAILGILEADAKWTEDSGVSFTTMAHRYAFNEINDLLYRETTRNNKFCRVSKSKEIPHGLLLDEGETEDGSFFDKLREDVFLVAEDLLSKEEYRMFTDLYHYGDRIAVRNYIDRTGENQRKANRVKHKVRKIMSEVFNDVGFNRL